MEKYDYKFETKPDTGSLHSSQSKRTQQSPDYWGVLCVNMRDTTNISVENGIATIKVSGWKQVGKGSGKTYLALKVNRFVPEEEQKTSSGYSGGGKFSSNSSDKEDVNLPF